jgi:glycosyltransferase involved in cell wall biosynthesis
MTAPRRASVVIATRDRPEALARCLASVRTAMTERDELIVVDSASSDGGQVERVAGAAGGRCLRLDQRGSARARNFGAAQAGGSFLAFADDDAVVEPLWLDVLGRRFSEPNVGAVVGPVLELGRTPPALLLHFVGFDPLRDEATFERGDDDWFARVQMGAIGSGTNLAVRRDVFESVGPFRPGLGAGAAIAGDENYLLLSLVEGGYRVVNEPTARVHHPPQSRSRLLEISADRAAYYLYVWLTRPGLRRPCVGHLFAKLSRPRPRIPTGVRSSVAAALLAAPAKLAAARRMDREPVTTPG